MKNILLISDGIQDINRMRRYYDSSFTIKATSNLGSAVYVAETSDIGMIMYNVGVEFEKLFIFYKELRENKKTQEIPLIAIADISILKPLNDCVDLKNTHLLGSAITRENMRKIIYSTFGEIPPEFS